MKGEIQLRPAAEPRIRVTSGGGWSVQQVLAMRARSGYRAALAPCRRLDTSRAEQRFGWRATTDCRVGLVPAIARHGRHRDSARLATLPTGAASSIPSAPAAESEPAADAVSPRAPGVAL